MAVLSENVRDTQPEWCGYIAAFDAYVDARARGDDEHAAQARRLMRGFAEPLAMLSGVMPRTRRLGRPGRDLEPLLEMLDR